MAAALLAAGACTRSSEQPPGAARSADPSGLPDAGAGSAVATSPDAAADAVDAADVAALEEARAAVGARLDLVRRVARRHPRLARDLRPLTRAHRAHDELLAASAVQRRAVGAPPPVPGSRDRALALVRAQEETLQRRLGELAGTVTSGTSGPVARLLASMSAAVAQQLAALPISRPGGDGR